MSMGREYERQNVAYEQRRWKQLELKEKKIQ